MKRIRRIFLLYAMLGLTSTANARDIRLLEPEFAPGSFLGVPWTGLLGEGLVPWFGFMIDYADDELVTVKRSEPGPNATVLSRSPIIDGRVAGTVAAGLNLFSIGTVSLTVPFFVTQGADLDSGVVMGDMDLNVRARIAGADDEGFGFGLTAGLGIPSGAVDQWTGMGKVTGHVGILWHYQTRDGFRLAVSVKRRFRPTLNVFGGAVGSDLRWGLAGRAPLHRRLALAVEFDGVAGASDHSTSIADRTYATEGRLSLLVDVGMGFEIRPFWAAGVTEGLGAPDFRVGLGVQWAPQQTKTVRAPHPVAPGGGGAETLQPPTGARPTALPFEPFVPASADAFASALATDPDGDADGVRGQADRCPDQAEDMDGFQDDDGCPDPDNDQDAIPVRDDLCPLEPATSNGVTDEDGCPDISKTDVAPIFNTVDNAYDLGEIPFLSGSEKLKEDAKPVLQKFALFFQGQPRLGRLVIEGHTDDEGDREFNVDLSERRAASVRAFLVAEGVEPERLIARGYGATRPVAPNTSAAGRARNRRVVFRIDKNFEGPRPTTGGSQ